MKKLIKFNTKMLKKDNVLSFNLYTQNHVLLLPTGTKITEDLLDKLEENDFFMESNNLLDDVDYEDEAKVSTTNKLSQLKLGKEVISFNLLQKEANGYSFMKCNYVGWIKDLAIVIEMPKIGNGDFAKYNMLDPGQKVQAKMQVGNIDYIFQTFVMSITTNPLPLAFLKHPVTVKTSRVISSS